ncbi:MAG: hypothetical protein WD992_00135 [Candidatus Levyibacteriota bacterium]
MVFIELDSKKGDEENMSPEIRRNGQLIARVPDETGIHTTLNGKPLYINVDLINADANRQLVIVDSQETSGLRILGLTQQGIGSSNHRGGDKKSPEISVRLLDRPIRVTYSRLEKAEYEMYPVRGTRQTLRNPRWMKGHGQR